MIIIFFYNSFSDKSLNDKMKVIKSSFNLQWICGNAFTHDTQKLYIIYQWPPPINPWKSVISCSTKNFEWYLISFRVSLLLSLPLPYHFVQSLLPLVLVNQTHLLTQHIKILLDLHYHSCNYCQHLLAGNEDIYHKFDELRKKNLYCFPSIGMRLILKSHLMLEPV